MFEEGVAVGTELYSDANGTFISGVAPIRDASDRIVTLMHADLDVDGYLTEVHVAKALLDAWVGWASRYVPSVLSNGRAEGLNGKIRTITRRSFGFTAPIRSSL